MKKIISDFYANNFDEFKKNTMKLMEDNSLRMKLGRNGLEYVKREHGSSMIIDKYEKLFKKLLS